MIVTSQNLFVDTDGKKKVTEGGKIGIVER